MDCESWTTRWTTLRSRGDAIEIRNTRVARRAAFSHTSCVTSFDACTVAQSSFDPWAILTPNFVANPVLHSQVRELVGERPSPFPLSAFSTARVGSQQYFVRLVHEVRRNLTFQRYLPHVVDKLPRMQPWMSRTHS